VRAGDRRGAGAGRGGAQARHSRHAQDDEAGSVLVDIAIDQGGCFETSRATTHEDPVYEVDGVIHYCVANMPGAVARTSAFALNNATLPFVLRIAANGAEAAMAADPHLAAGLNVSGGKIRHEAVADALDLEFEAA
jgi:alanine dehydrogenase